MKINPVILDAVKKGNVITTSQVVDMGFSRYLLSKYVKEGLLERERHGVYSLPDSIQDDMYIITLKLNKVIFSHETALFLNGLSDRTPFIHSITIPSNTRVSNVLQNECMCFYIKPELHQIGVTVKKTTFGNEVSCYNAERTICDILRSRKRLDEEMVIGAIKNYIASTKKDLNLLAKYAKQFNVENVLNRYLEVLL